MNQSKHVKFKRDTRILRNSYILERLFIYFPLKLCNVLRSRWFSGRIRKRPLFQCQWRERELEIYLDRSWNRFHCSPSINWKCLAKPFVTSLMLKIAFQMPYEKWDGFNNKNNCNSTKTNFQIHGTFISIVVALFVAY